MWISPDVTFPSDCGAFEELRLENEELRARVAELTELLEGSHADLSLANEALRTANETIRGTYEALREASRQEAA